jgi:hypothetical protein
MLRIQIAAVLFLGAAMAHAQGNFNKYLGEYTAVTVCDEHSVEPGVKPHVLKNGNFIIAQFTNSDGKKRAIIVGNNVANKKFSEYDWYGVEFEFKPGPQFPGIEINCSDSVDRSLRENLEERSYIFNRDRLTPDQIANLKATLKREAGDMADGYERLSARFDFHKGGKCRETGGVCHEIDIYKEPEGGLFIEYSSEDGDIHAGHVHN